MHSLGPFPIQPVATPVGSTHLILFLHGLDGHWRESWGQRRTAGKLGNASKADTAGNFMERISAHFANARVASVDYPSSMAGFASDAHGKVSAVAEAWADQLEADYLGHYASVAFVTHCLGGLVTLQALRRLAERAVEARQRPKGGALPALKVGNGQTNTLLFCLLMDTPLRWPRQALALPNPITGVIQQLGINEADLAANLAYFESAEGMETMQLASVASSIQNWLSPFDPLALARPAASWHLSVRHEDLSRAPAFGPFEPLSIAVQCLEKFFNGWPLATPSFLSKSRRSSALGPTRSGCPGSGCVRCFCQPAAWA